MKYIFDNNRGTMLEYEHTGSSLYYFKEYAYDDSTNDFTDSLGTVDLTYSEVRKMSGGKELLAELSEEGWDAF